MIIKLIAKNTALFLPIIYSLIKIKSDFNFYLIFSIAYFLIITLYYILKNKNFYSYLTQLGISYIFMDLTFHNIDFKTFFNSFKLIDIRFLFVIMISMIFVLFIRAYKWKYLFAHIKPVRVSSLYKTVIVGFMYNSILPARAGEVYRAFFLNKLEGISKSTVLGTVVFERIMDGVIIGWLVIYILLFGFVSNRVIYKIGLIGLGFYVLCIALLIIFYYNKKLVIKILNKLLFFIPEKFIKNILISLDSFYEGLHIFKNYKNLFNFIFYTLLLWVISILINYLYLKSVGIFQIFNFGISELNFTLLLVCLIVFGISIPSGPGAIGPFHASIFFTFYLMNPEFVKVGTYKYNIIAFFSMYIWLTQILLFVISGLFVLTRIQFEKKKVSKEKGKKKVSVLDI